METQIKICWKSFDLLLHIVFIYVHSDSIDVWQSLASECIAASALESLEAFCVCVCVCVCFCYIDALAVSREWPFLAGNSLFCIFISRAATWDRNLHHGAASLIIWLGLCEKSGVGETQPSVVLLWIRCGGAFFVFFGFDFCDFLIRNRVAQRESPLEKNLREVDFCRKYLQVLLKIWHDNLMYFRV